MKRIKIIKIILVILVVLLSGCVDNIDLKKKTEIRFVGYKNNDLSIVDINNKLIKKLGDFQDVFFGAPFIKNDILQVSIENDDIKLEFDREGNKVNLSKEQKRYQNIEYNGVYPSFEGREYHISKYDYLTNFNGIDFNLKEDYDYILTNYMGYAIAGKNNENNVEVIDENGNVVIQLDKSLDIYLPQTRDDKRIVVSDREKRKMSIYDVKGVLVNELHNLDCIIGYREGYLPVTNYRENNNSWMEYNSYNAAEVDEETYKNRELFEVGYLNEAGEFSIERKFKLYPDKMSLEERAVMYRDDTLQMNSFSFYNGLAVVCDAKEELFGAVNKKGDWVVEPKYEYMSDYINGFAIARTSGKSGVINTNGKWIINPEYDDLAMFIDDEQAKAEKTANEISNDIRFLVNIDGENSLIDEKGKTIRVLKDIKGVPIELENFIDDGLIDYSYYTDINIHGEKVNLSYDEQLLNLSPYFRLQMVYEKLYNLEKTEFEYDGEYDYVLTNHMGYGIVFSQNREKKIIDKKGNVILETDLKEKIFLPETAIDKRFVLYDSSNEIIKVYDMKGALIKKIKNACCYNGYSEGYLVYGFKKPEQEKIKKYAYLDENGDKAFEGEYKVLFQYLDWTRDFLSNSDRHMFKNGRATVRNSNTGKYGVINKKGKWILKPKYEYLSDYINDMAIAQVKGKRGVINRKGDWILENKYDHIYIFF